MNCMLDCFPSNTLLLWEEWLLRYFVWRVFLISFTGKKWMINNVWTRGLEKKNDCNNSSATSQVFTCYMPSLKQLSNVACPLKQMASIQHNSHWPWQHLHTCLHLGSLRPFYTNYFVQLKQTNQFNKTAQSKPILQFGERLPLAFTGWIYWKDVEWRHNAKLEPKFIHRQMTTEDQSHLELVAWWFKNFRCKCSTYSYDFTKYVYI